MNFEHISTFTPTTYMERIREFSRAHMAAYHAAREAKKKPRKPDWGWCVNACGTFILRIRNRKPPYLTKTEYKQLVESVEASDKELTRRDVDRTLEKRKLPIK